MQLVKYEQNALGLWVDEATGLVYVHRSAIARMLGRDPDCDHTLESRLKLVSQIAEVRIGDRIRITTFYPVSAVFDLAGELNLEISNQLADHCSSCK